MRKTWLSTIILANFTIVTSLGFSTTGFAYQEKQDENSQQQKSDDDVQIKGKIIIVGPDGKERIIDLSDTTQHLDLVPLQDHLGRLNIVPQLRLNSIANQNEFFIGVGCSQPSAALADQLDLGDRGLLVDSVNEDSPAAKSGLKPHDIILSVDGNSMTDVGELVKAVQAAGKDDRALKMEIVRKGKVESIEIIPAKSDKNAQGDTGPDAERLRGILEKAMKERNLPGFKLDPKHLRGGGGVRIIPPLRVNPLPSEKIDQLEKMMEQLQKQFEQLQKEHGNDR
jgi:membrane-associated protease RseP (regulator of RpoE activity)